jgi:hypothetical protein
MIHGENRAESGLPALIVVVTWKLDGAANSMWDIATARPARAGTAKPARRAAKHRSLDSVGPDRL